jgi:hypothetical protein
MCCSAWAGTTGIELWVDCSRVCGIFFCIRGGFLLSVGRQILGL